MRKLVRSSKLLVTILALSGFFVTPFVRGDIVYANPPVVQKLATTLSSNETWDSSSIYVIGEVTVPSGVTLTIEEGTIVKVHTMFSGINGIKVEAGGTLIVSGTSIDPVTFTSLKDDSIGGDSGNDGATTGQPGDYATAIRVFGGSAEIEHAAARYGTLAFHVDCSYSGTEAEVTDNLFENSVYIWSCSPEKIDLLRNEFDIDAQEAGLNIKTMDLSSIVLAGTNKNTFTGTGNVVWTDSSSGVPTGSTWTVSGDSGAVILTNAFDTIEGTLNLEPGAIIKTTGYAFTVDDGGIINSNGSASDPVIFTSALDDAVGGVSFDSSGYFGNPEEGDYGTAIHALTGSRVHAAHTVFKYALSGVKLEGGDSNFEATTLFSDATNALEVSGDAKVAFRGQFEEVSDRVIRACDWESNDCVVDAAYIDWGSEDGPWALNSNGNPIACGSVTVSPWMYNSNQVHDDNAWALDNCGGGAPQITEGLIAAASNYDSVMAGHQIDCDNGFQDVCDYINTVQTCHAQAWTLAASQSPFPLPDSSAGEYGQALAGDLVSTAGEYIRSTNPTAYSGYAIGAGTNVLSAVMTSLQIRNAYDTCFSV